MPQLKDTFRLRVVKKDIESARQYQDHAYCLIATMLQRRGFKLCNVSGLTARIGGREFNIRKVDGSFIYPIDLGYESSYSNPEMSALGFVVQFTRTCPPLS